MPVALTNLCYCPMLGPLLSNIAARGGGGFWRKFRRSGYCRIEDPAFDGLNIPLLRGQFPVPNSQFLPGKPALKNVLFLSGQQAQSPGGPMTGLAIMTVAFNYGLLFVIVVYWHVLP